MVIGTTVFHSCYYNFNIVEFVDLPWKWEFSFSMEIFQFLQILVKNKCAFNVWQFNTSSSSEM